jgi:nitroreductase
MYLAGHTLFIYFKTVNYFLALLKDALLSTIFWRESWKYGERAYRYCNLDVGHAVACLSFSANLQGWKITYLNALSDNELEKISGFHQTAWKEHEKEEPDLLCFVYPHEVKNVSHTLPSLVITALSELSFKGTPNQLSREHVNWDIIYKTAHYAQKLHTKEKIYNYSDRPFRKDVISDYSASTIIRKRRSAVSFNKKGSTL